MHPSFTSRLSSFLNLVLGTSISHAHPQLWRTKGETLSELKNRGLAADWWLTCSCARDQRHVALDDRKVQCGICAGCLLRRQSVHAARLISDEDTFLWKDLTAETMNSVSPDRVTNSNDEHQAQCAVLQMHHFGRIAAYSERVSNCAEELSDCIGEDAAEVEQKLRRLILAHAAEWDSFRSSLGPTSFINQWVSVLQ
jgi:hypothetical protein